MNEPQAISDESPSIISWREADRSEWGTFLYFLTYSLSACFSNTLWLDFIIAGYTIVLLVIGQTYHGSFSSSIAGGSLTLSEISFKLWKACFWD